MTCTLYSILECTQRRLSKIRFVIWNAADCIAWRLVWLLDYIFFTNLRFIKMIRVAFKYYISMFYIILPLSPCKHELRPPHPTLTCLCNIRMEICLHYHTQLHLGFVANLAGFSLQDGAPNKWHYFLP